VLLFTPGVGEAEVNKLDFVFLDHFHDVCDGLCHQNLLLLDGWLKNCPGALLMHFLCQSQARLVFSRTLDCAAIVALAEGTSVYLARASLKKYKCHAPKRRILKMHFDGAQP
jgi:hypothetical protein